MGFGILFLSLAPRTNATTQLPFTFAEPEEADRNRTINSLHLPSFHSSLSFLSLLSLLELFITLVCVKFLLANRRVHLNTDPPNSWAYSVANVQSACVHIWSFLIGSMRFAQSCGSHRFSLDPFSSSQSLAFIDFVAVSLAAYCLELDKKMPSEWINDNKE